MKAKEKHQLRGLIGDLLRHGQVETTPARVKKLRAIVDRLVVRAKRKDVVARRLAIKIIGDRKLAGKLIEEIAPRFQDRKSGFTRLLRLGKRRGDAAPRLKVEFIEFPSTPLPIKAVGKEKERKETATERQKKTMKTNKEAKKEKKE